MLERRKHLRAKGIFGTTDKKEQFNITQEES